MTDKEREIAIANVSTGFTRGYTQGFNDARKKYERPHGEWIFKHNSSDIWCSNCDENFDEIPQKFLFCPNCGSDNRGEKTEDNDRDCESCVHYKIYKDNDLYACEKWECEYEKKEG